LHEAFTAQGFGQVSSPGLWLPHQFTLWCSTSLYTNDTCRCSAGDKGIKEKAGRRYADIANFAVGKIAGSKRRCPDKRGNFTFTKFFDEKDAYKFTGGPAGIQKKSKKQGKNPSKIALPSLYIGGDAALSNNEHPSPAKRESIYKRSNL
jgi:hypothetical protein